MCSSTPRLVTPSNRDFVGGQFLQQRLDRVPHGAPRRAELSGQSLHGGVFATQLADRPKTRPNRQQGTRLGEIVVLLGERPARTGRFGAAPGPLAPGQLDRPGHAWHVHQPHLPTAVAVRDHSAGRAALLARWRLDHDPERRSSLGLVLGDIGNVEAGQADQHVAAVAVDVISIKARRNTRRRLGHCRGLPVE